MNLKSVITPRNALLSTPFVFFTTVFVFAIGLCILITFQDSPSFRIGENEPAALFFFAYLISFCGSVILLFRFSERPSFRNYIIPYSFFTAFGSLLCIIKWISHGTIYDWPLIPLSDLLLNLINLILTPAIAVLFIPFINEMKFPPKMSFRCLTLISLVAAGMALIIIANDILPFFDAEFVWSKLWDFRIADMWVSLLYELYITFGMTLVGCLSLLIIDEYLKNNSALDGGS
jgi:hypothetical protein